MIDLVDSLRWVRENIANFGGGMANTFLKASGHEIGRSLCEDDLVDTANALIEKMKIRPKAYKEELKGFVRTRKAKPVERNSYRTVGAPSPFDYNKKIE